MGARIDSARQTGYASEVLIRRKRKTCVAPLSGPILGSRAGGEYQKVMGNNMRTTSRARSDAVRQKEG
jgi:hypothetical protein